MYFLYIYWMKQAADLTFWYKLVYFLDLRNFCILTQAARIFLYFLCKINILTVLWILIKALICEKTFCLNFFSGFALILNFSFAIFLSLLTSSTAILALWSAILISFLSLYSAYFLLCKAPLHQACIKTAAILSCALVKVESSLFFFFWKVFSSILSKLWKWELFWLKSKNFSVFLSDEFSSLKFDRLRNLCLLLTLGVNFRKIFFSEFFWLFPAFERSKRLFCNFCVSSCFTPSFVLLKVL